MKIKIGKKPFRTNRQRRRFSDAFRDELRASSYTTECVADHLGVSKSSIKNYASGVGMPSVPRMKKLVEMFPGLWEKIKTLPFWKHAGSKNSGPTECRRTIGVTVTLRPPACNGIPLPPIVPKPTPAPQSQAPTPKPPVPPPAAPPVDHLAAAKKWRNGKFNEWLAIKASAVALRMQATEFDAQANGIVLALARS